MKIKNTALIIIFLVYCLIITGCNSGIQQTQNVNQPVNLTFNESSNSLMNSGDNGLNWQKSVTSGGTLFDVRHNQISVTSYGVHQRCINQFGGFPIVTAGSFGSGVMALNSIGQKFIVNIGRTRSSCTKGPIQFSGNSFTENNRPDSVAIQDPMDSESPAMVTPANGRLYISSAIESSSPTNVFAPANVYITDVIYLHERRTFYAVGNYLEYGQRTYAVYTSSDGGRTWNLARRFNPTNLSVIYNQIRYNAANNQFEFFNANDNTSSFATIISISVESNNWHEESTELSGNIQNISYGNNVSIAVGNNGQIIRSQNNGATWELIKYDSKNINTLYDVSFTNGIFLISGLNNEGNFISLTSESGDVFTTTDIPYFSTMSSGYDFNCGIDSLTQALFCWGSGYNSKLGYGSSEDILLPKHILSNSSFNTVSAGGNHACALDANKQISCWGDNTYGQLGNPNNKQPSVPTLVTQFPDLIYNQVTLGKQHSCALGLDIKSKNINKILCWGDNTKGQLGIDDSITKSSVPEEITGLSSTNFVQVAATYYNTCVITNKRKVYCWGDNSYGQLGLGKTKYTTYYRPEKLAKSFSFISSGPSEHVCALDESGTAYCWGRNDTGQLGVNNTEDQNKPIPVATNLQFYTIGTGGGHTCAISKAYDLYCWGDNRLGQLGNGESSSIPILVPTNHVIIPDQSGQDVKWASVSMGYNHTCGTTFNGKNYCWGDNYNGQVGDNSRIERNSPTWINSNTESETEQFINGLD